MADDSGEADTERFDDTDYDDADYADTAEYDGDPEFDEDYDEYADGDYERRPYRPGRGGFDAEAAALTARARYTFRQRVVVLMLLSAVITILLAVTVSPLLWWTHVAIDLGLVGYLGYLRRQVRIEEEIRERRTARLAAQQPRRVPEPEPEVDTDDSAEVDEYEEPVPRSVLPQRQPLTRHVHPGTVVVDTDDEDPVFAELDEPGALPYRRAVGE
jgi:hypothetical protein